MEMNVTLRILFIAYIIHQCHTHASPQKNSSTCTSMPGGNQDSVNKLYHASSKQCYDFATRGPCGENMIFYKHPFNPKYGFCDCDQGIKSKYPCRDHPVRKMVYFPSWRKCFPIFSQGPCKNRFWLNYETQSTKVTCQPNPCISTQLLQDPTFDWKGSSSKFWFYDPLSPSRNPCHLSQTQGYCADGLTLELTHGSHLPRCKKQICYGKLTNFRTDLSCRPGSRYSYLWRGCFRTARYFYGIG